MNKSQEEVNVVLPAYQIWERGKDNALDSHVIVLGVRTDNINGKTVILRACRRKGDCFIIPPCAQKSYVGLNKFLKKFRSTGSVFTEENLPENKEKRQRKKENPNGNLF